ncbi:MAG: DUF5696 domain-containing protein [Saccharofermentanales bacterium]
MMNAYMKKNYKKLIYIALISVVITLCGCSDVLIKPIIKNDRIDYSKIDLSFDTDIKYSTGMQIVYENNYAVLYVNGSTTEIAIKDKKTDIMWYSNPFERGKDTIAVDPADKINAALTFKYMQYGTSDDFNPSNTNLAQVNLNSCADSVKKGQYSFSKINQGIRVNYGVGTKVDTYLCPQILSIDRYNELTAKMNKEDKEYFVGNYSLFSLKDFKIAGDPTLKAVFETKIPILKKRDVYLISSLAYIDAGAPPENHYAKRKIEEIMKRISYTQSDLDKDNSENLVVVPKPTNVYFDISIEYKLDGPDLIARIPKDSIKYNDDIFHLTNVSVMPFFGAAGTDKKGYMLIPDGSGALINLNNGKQIFPPYEKKVYGNDVTLKYKNLDDTQIYLPVFGMKQNADAFLAIIEKGDSSSLINAEISGRENNYNSVYSSFIIQSSGQNYVSILGQGGLVHYQENTLQSDIQIRYIFLSGDHANYTGMAARYQKYLLDNELMKKQEIKNNIPLYVDMIGAISYNASFLGIPYKSRLPLTSYSQVKKMLIDLKSKGINDIDLQYTNWCNGGLENTIADKADLVSKLGSRKELDELTKYAVENSIDFYPQVEFEYTTETTFFRLFQKKSLASRYMDNTVLIAFITKSIPDFQFQLLVVSPLYYDHMINEFMSDYDKLGIKGLSLGTLGTDLNGDYRKGSQADRQNAKDIVISQLGKLKNGYNLSIKGANAYTLKFADIVNNIPSISGENYLFDETIPFYQMVLHGIIPYSSEPLNICSDYDTQVLRLIESGTVPSFRWMYEENSVLKDTVSDFYGINYNAWKDQAIDAYHKINDALAGCQTSTIISHNIIQKGLSQTIYSNGTRIYVNFNDFETKDGDVTISPRNYKVIKGGRV